VFLCQPTNVNASNNESQRHSSPSIPRRWLVTRIHPKRDAQVRSTADHACVVKVGGGCGFIDEQEIQMSAPQGKTAKWETIRWVVTAAPFLR